MLNASKAMAVRLMKTRYRGAEDAVFSSGLLSFITPDHFICRVRGKHNRHPNIFEYRSWVACLMPYARELVCTDYRSTTELDAQLVIGFGSGFSRNRAAAKKAFYYATGAGARFQAQAVAREYDRVRTQFGSTCLGGFRVPESDGSTDEQESALIYCIANSFSADTFSRPRSDLRLLPGIALSPGGRQSPGSDPISMPADDLLWLGPRGVLHKGLHIAAEVARRSNRRLIAVGVSRAERKLAGKILRASGADFELHGFVSVGSEHWRQLVSRCTFTIGCSVSEGMSTSLLTAAAHGLIPVCTDTCGIDLGFSVPFHERTTLAERLSEQLAEVARRPAEDVQYLRDAAIRACRRQHTPEAFARQLSEHLRQDLAP